MKESKFSLHEQEILIKIAREAVQAAANRHSPKEINWADLPERLQQDGASFITLTNGGRLRGCIGTLEASQSLALDVQEHAVAAATQDFRFQNVQPGELDDIEIEISVLTPMEKLDYDDPQDLISKIRPGVDGVTLIGQSRRATFLPQVWEKVQDPVDFLNHLCMKMGEPPDFWQAGTLDVYIYQVDEIKEAL